MIELPPGTLSLNDLLTIISLAIGGLGFILSLINLVYTIASRRVKLTVSLKSSYHSRYGDTICVKVLNNSSNPVSISRITLQSTTEEVDFGVRRLPVYSVMLGRPQDFTEKLWYSDILPFRIEAKGCALLLLTSEDEKWEATEGEYTMRIYTGTKTVQSRIAINSCEDSQCIQTSKAPYS